MVNDRLVRRAIVLAGGEPLTPPLTRPLPDGAVVVAADGGLELAAGLGLHVDLLVGDLDSVSSATLARARAAGTTVQQHPVDKDATDLALALDAVAADGPAEVTVVGGHGGRLDHLLGNVSLLAAPRYRALRLTALLGPAVLHVVHDAVELTGSAGELVSLLATHGPARGVRTTGLRFPLHDDLLPPGSSRGVSNRFLATTATVTLESGVLVTVQPEASRTLPTPQR